MNECETTAGEFVGAAEDASEVSPPLWIDATYVKVRRNNRVVSVAAPPGRSRPGTTGRSAT